MGLQLLLCHGWNLKILSCLSFSSASSEPEALLILNDPKLSEALEMGSVHPAGIIHISEI